MRKSLLSTAAASLMLVAGVSGASAMPNRFKAMERGLKNSPCMQKVPGSFLQKTVDANGIVTPDFTLTATYVQEMFPTGWLLSPTGETWFYTLETEGTTYRPEGWLPNWNFSGFKLTVYNGLGQPVGYAYGKIELPEGAGRCNYVLPEAQLSSTFFNSNSTDIEVMMTFNFNPIEFPDPDNPYKGVYGSKQFTAAYSLQAAMPATPQTPLFECPGALSTTLKSSTSAEGFVFGFTYYSTWENEKNEADKNTLRVYKPAGWGTPPSLIVQQTTSQTPGDGLNEAVPLFVVLDGNDVYSVKSYLEKPYLLDSSADVPVMTPDNHYIIEMYKVGNEPLIEDDTDPDAVKLTPTYTVTIPVAEISDPSKYHWRSYALGNFRGEKDVTWDFGTGNDPCFVITIVDSNLQQDESVAFYEVYDKTGKKIKEFGTESGAFTEFPAIEGHPMQLGFDVKNDEGDDVTRLYDWPSLEFKGELPSLFVYEGNVYILSSVPTRVPGEGGVLYAANAALAATAEGESAFSYVAYFRPDGTLHHMDTLTLPENTAKAYALVTAEVLDPYLYNTDSKYEYLLWLYTWKGEGKVGTSLAAAVVDETGKILAKRELPDEHDYETAYVSNNPNKRFIILEYHDGSKFSNPANIEFIGLPLNDFEGQGTVEDPYLIYTYGDFNRIRNNLTSHFALAANVDMENRAIGSIEGTFTGTIDGRGHSVKNLYLSLDAMSNKKALFNNIGERPATEDEEETTDAPRAAIRNITFDGVTFHHAATNLLGTKQHALLAHTARYADFENVHMINPKASLENVSINFAALANVADNCKFIDCAVKDADFNFTHARGLAGIVYDARGCEVKNAFVSGTFKGRNNVAGVMAVANAEPSTVTDCHVNATLEATNSNAGGIIANNTLRSIVKNCVVEGTITADENVGGILGQLGAPELPEAGYIIENNIVALQSFNVGTEPKAAHRIVGYTTIDDGTRNMWVDNPEYDPNDPNSSAGSYQEVPAQPEVKIGVNHVVSAIAPVEAADGEPLATEGTTTALDELDDAAEFFAGLGFKFGSDSANPWNQQPTFMYRVPTLYYEDNIGVSLQFTPAAYTGAPEAEITLYLEVASFADLFEFSDNASISVANPAIAEWTNLVPVEGNDNLVGIVLTLGKTEGTTTVTATCKGKTATATVTVTNSSAIVAIGADNNAISYANGIITAEGRAITLYDAQGRQMAAGFDTLATTGLNAGLYIVRATTADGNAETLKIMVR